MESMSLPLQRWRAPVETVEGLAVVETEDVDIIDRIADQRNKVHAAAGDDLGDRGRLGQGDHFHEDGSPISVGQVREEGLVDGPTDMVRLTDLIATPTLLRRDEGQVHVAHEVFGVEVSEQLSGGGKVAAMQNGEVSKELIVPREHTRPGVLPLPSVHVLDLGHAPAESGSGAVGALEYALLDKLVELLLPNPPGHTHRQQTHARYQKQQRLRERRHVLFVLSSSFFFALPLK
jgi:hypothetical protein